ncbi:MAG TPA: hypothetical protein VGG06_23230 [Thermoanaerobaculia bacterium]|jgi:hypothetical protein
MPWTLTLALALLALAATTGTFLRRASRARREISARLHDHALALDRRCDALQEQIRRLDELRRVDHLFVLVALNEADGRLPPEAARALRHYALELRAELAALA